MFQFICKQSVKGKVKKWRTSNVLVQWQQTYHSVLSGKTLRRHGRSCASRSHRVQYNECRHGGL